MLLDLIFPVRGGTLPTEHRYALFGGVSKLVPAFHDPTTNFRFATITGQYAGNGVLNLDARSRLRCRVPADAIAQVLPLAGKELRIGSQSVRLGVPQVVALQPMPTLTSPLVTFKNSTEPERFLEVARDKLSALGVSGSPQLPVIQAGERAGQPRRKVVRIAGRTVVGFALLVAELTAEESLLLQEHGLGGRTRMGCGFFFPHVPRV